MTDYDGMTPASMLRELKRKDAVIERQAAELEGERSLWTDRDARETAPHPAGFSQVLAGAASV